MPVAGRRECHSHTLQLKLRSTLHDSVAYRNLTATFHTSLINQVCIIPLKLSFTPTRINKQSKKSLFLLFLELKVDMKGSESELSMPDGGFTAGQA